MTDYFQRGRGWSIHLLGILATMIAHASEIKDSTFIDVRAGQTGIIGILASKLGAKEIVLVERDHDALEILGANLKQNKVENARMLLRSIEDVEQINTEKPPIVVTNTPTLAGELGQENIKTFELDSIVRLFPKAKLLILGGGAHWYPNSEKNILSILERSGFKLGDKVLVRQVRGAIILDDGKRVPNIEEYDTPLIARPVNASMKSLARRLLAKNTLGGIDLNPTQMSMQVKKNSQDFKFDFNGTEIDAAQVTGAKFTIHTMTPVKDLLSIIGLN